MKYLLNILILITIMSINIYSQDYEWRKWAQRPPMGWNSYDCFGATVEEHEVKANANYMADNLKDYGWEYIVVDFNWSYPHPPASIDENVEQFKTYRGTIVPWLAMDDYGRVLPDWRKFPSSFPDKGFKPLADYIHSLGLKFGIHIMRGIPRQAVYNKYPIKGALDIDASMIADTNSICSWLGLMYGIDMNKKGAQEYLNSLFELYADWGVDYVKVDDMNGVDGVHGYHKAEVEGYRKAIDNCGREIVLSISPQIDYSQAAGHIENNSNLWRISADFWDEWEKLKEMFGLIEKWNESRIIGSWPDADMIPFGRIKRRGPWGKERNSLFTKDEHYTLMTLWSVVRSPLMFGGDMTLNDQFTDSLLTNEEVLEANITGSDPKLLVSTDDKVVWYSNSNDEGIYLAMFNLSENTADIEVNLTDVGLTNRIRARDLWKKEDLGEFDGTISQNVNSHGAIFLKLNDLKK